MGYNHIRNQGLSGIIMFLDNSRYLFELSGLSGPFENDNKLLKSPDAIQKQLFESSGKVSLNFLSPS